MDPDWAVDHARFRCRHCGIHTSSEVLATQFYLEGPPRGPEYRYRLVRCTACDGVLLLVAMRIGVEHGQDVYDEDVAVYPAPPRSMSPSVPSALQRCFEEARACYQVRAYTACAIMCRRALETLAVERGAGERNLAKALTKLREEGHIDQRLYDWCTELRFAGNDAAHDVRQDVPPADAKDMSELAEAIIDYVYVYQVRYEEFRKRRKESVESPKQQPGFDAP